MDLDLVINSRVSVRKFKDKPLSNELIKKLVANAGKAPSINNSQPWKFIAVVNKAILTKMSDSVKEKLESLFPDLQNNHSKSKVVWYSSFFSDAPCVIAISSEPYKAIVDDILESDELNHEEINRIRNYPNIQTIGAAVENLLLTAVDLDLGACWLTGPLIAKEELEEIIGIKAPNGLAAMVAVGYPFENVKPRPKKPLEEILEIIE